MHDVDGTVSWFTFTRDSLWLSKEGREELKARYGLVEAPSSNYRLYIHARDGFQPLALIRVVDDRLAFCMVNTYERTLGGIPLGAVSRVEWPRSTEEPTCDVLHRASLEDFVPKK